jgi:hypothetical protein
MDFRRRGSNKVGSPPRGSPPVSVAQRWKGSRCAKNPSYLTERQRRSTPRPRSKTRRREVAVAAANHPGYANSPVPLALPVLVVDHHRSSPPTGRRVDEGKVRELLSGRVEQVPACTRPATLLLATPVCDPRKRNWLLSGHCSHCVIIHPEAPHECRSIAGYLE